MKSESEVAQSCQTLCNPMNCSLPGTSVHGILQARILEWVAISFSRGSSQPRARTQVSCIVGRWFTVWATREAPKRVEEEVKRKGFPRRAWSSVSTSPSSLYRSPGCKRACVYESTSMWLLREKGEGTRDKIERGRLNPDRIGFWSPQVKTFEFYPINTESRDF